MSFICITENSYHDGTNQFFIPYEEELYNFLVDFVKETEKNDEYNINIGNIENISLELLNYQKTHISKFEYHIVGEIAVEELKEVEKSEDPQEYFEEIMSFIWKKCNKDSESPEESEEEN